MMNSLRARVKHSSKIFIISKFFIRILMSLTFFMILMIRSPKQTNKIIKHKQRTKHWEVINESCLLETDNEDYWTFKLGNCNFVEFLTICGFRFRKKIRKYVFFLKSWVGGYTLKKSYIYLCHTCMHNNKEPQSVWGKGAIKLELIVCHISMIYRMTKIIHKLETM